ncbi:MAG: response regulator [Synergistaceae bacterium]|nr:response regulator [Synergistaceae bacterium]
MKGNVAGTRETRVILVVEDDDDLRTLITRRLRREGFDAEGAALGREALDIALSRPGCLLLIDHNLPDMSGIDLVSLLKERGARNPFIFMTGRGDEQLAVRAMKLGALDYLVKGPGLLDRLPLTLEHQIGELETRRRVMEDRAILLDNIRTQIWYLTDERTYGAVNAAHAAFIGLKPEEMASKDLFELFSKDEAEVCMRSNVEVFSTGKPVLSEEHARSASGELRVMSIYKSPKLRDDGSVEYVVCSAEDITEQKMAEEALIEEKERAEWLGRKAEEASRAKSSFLANTSHELRTPLNGAIGFLDLLSDTVLDPTQKQYLGYIRSSMYSLLDVINEVLDISKVESDEFDLVLGPTDIPLLAEQALDVVRGNSLRKKLTISQNIFEEGPRCAMVDPVRLKQVLVNLLGNAVKFTDEGLVELTVEAAPSEDGRCDYMFSVRDTGIGIDSNCVEGLFEPFYQADSSTTRRHGGVGLGIPIAQSILKKMGSRLELESVPGEGSRFFFTLGDIETIPPDEAREDSTARPAIPPPLKTTRPAVILIAEDQKVNRRMLRIMVSKLVPGAVVLEAPDGEKTVELFGDERPDIVLMDLHMPTMSGYVATERIRSIEREQGVASSEKASIIAVTADVQTESKNACDKFGMDGFISKPLDVWELHECLKDALKGLLRP